jgi:hypothetical protein
MSPNIAIPLEVFGIGIVISYGIALLIKLLLICIRFFTRKREDKEQ